MPRTFARRLLLCLLLAATTPASHAEGNPRVRFQTSVGDLVIELDARRAPATVANFLAYVDDGFYVGTIFHRVIPGFMAQGGGFTADFERKPTRDPIPNEADNGLTNLAGTIAMARTGDPHSATSQFFINLVDNDYLNHADKGSGWGYCVFGRVVEGTATMARIGTIPTGPAGPFSRDVPTRSIVITGAERLDEPKP